MDDGEEMELKEGLGSAASGELSWGWSSGPGRRADKIYFVSTYFLCFFFPLFRGVGEPYYDWSTSGRSGAG